MTGAGFPNEINAQTLWPEPARERRTGADNIRLRTAMSAARIALEPTDRNIRKAINVGVMRAFRDGERSIEGLTDAGKAAGWSAIFRTARPPADEAPSPVAPGDPQAQSPATLPKAPVQSGSMRRRASLLLSRLRGSRGDAKDGALR